MEIDKPTITDLTAMNHTHASTAQGGSISAANIANGAALSKTDDANVTLTLGGVVASSLLKAVSLTLGWTGLLASSRGGTGNGFTKFSGPTTAEKTFTLPDASATLVTTTTLNNTTLPVSATTLGASGALTTNKIKEVGNSIGFGTTSPAASLAGTEGIVSYSANGAVALATPSKYWLNYVSGSDLRWFEGGVAVDKMILSSTGLAVTGAISATTTIATGGYTVATLPAGTVGQCAYVTDASAPTYNTALTGGGVVRVPVFRNATVWVSA